MRLVWGAGPGTPTHPQQAAQRGVTTGRVRALSCVTSLMSPYAGGALTQGAEPAGETPNDL